MKESELQVLDEGKRFGGLLFSQVYAAYKHVPCLRDLLKAYADTELSKTTNCVAKSLSHWGMHNSLPIGMSDKDIGVEVSTIDKNA